MKIKGSKIFSNRSKYIFSKLIKKKKKKKKNAQQNILSPTHTKNF